MLKICLILTILISNWNGSLKHLCHAALANITQSPTTTPSNFTQLPTRFPSTTRPTPTKSPSTSALDRDWKIVCNLFSISPCVSSTTASFATVSLVSGEYRITNIFCRQNSQRVALPDNIGSLDVLDTLNLYSCDVTGEIPSSLGMIRSLTYLDLSYNPSLTGDIPQSFSNFNLNANSMYISLLYTNIGGSVPCGNYENLIPYNNRYFLSNFGGACFPVCTTALANKMYTWISEYDSMVDDFYTQRTLSHPQPCLNSMCKAGEYADMSSNVPQNITCRQCPMPFSGSQPFSMSPKACYSIVTNVGGSFVALALSLYLIVIYVYYARFHFAAFVRMERITLPLIAYYKITIRSLLKLQSQLKARSYIDTAERRLKRGTNILMRGFHVLTFYILSSLVVFVWTCIVYFAIMWRRMYDSLVLLNGVRSSLDTFVETINDLFKFSVSLPDFVQDLIEPTRKFLIMISKISLNFGAVKIDCIGGKAPFNLLVQILIFGLAVIVVMSEYQVFKVNMFGELFSNFLNVISSRSYRKFTMNEDDRFHWSFGRYLLFLFYSSIASISSAFLDYTLVLKFFLTLIRFETLTYFYKLAQFSSFLPLWWWVFPFFGGIFIQFGDNKNLGKITDPQNVCDVSVPGMEGVDSYLVYITSYITIFLMLPIVYEVGKIIAPGNRIKYRRDLMKIAERRATLPLGRLYSIIPAYVTKYYKAFTAVSDTFRRILFLTAFDIWVAELAERWLALVRQAIPAMMSSRTSNLEDFDGISKGTTKLGEDVTVAKPIVSKRGSLGWSAVVQDSSTSIKQLSDFRESEMNVKIINSFEGMHIIQRMFISQSHFNDQNDISKSATSNALANNDNAIEIILEAVRNTQFFNSLFAPKPLSSSHSLEDPSHIIVNPEVDIQQTVDNIHISAYEPTSLPTVTSPPSSPSLTSDNTTSLTIVVVVDKLNADDIQSVIETQAEMESEAKEETVVFKNGHVFMGLFVDNMAQGEGKITFASGNVVYIGGFHQGKYHGRGILITKAEKLMIDCYFVYGVAHGHGKILKIEEDQLTINEIHWRNGISTICSCITLREIYEGEFNEAGQYHGEGHLLSFHNGESYNGGWEKGKRNGRGTCIYANGSSYIGEWKNDLYHGPGSLLEENGREYSGDFAFGKRMCVRIGLSPASDPLEERLRWQDYQAFVVMPSFSDFMSYQYRRILYFLQWPDKGTGIFLKSDWLIPRVILNMKIKQKNPIIFNLFISTIELPLKVLNLAIDWTRSLIAASFVWYGFGHLCLSRSRDTWRQIFYNYCIFFCSALGIWTRQARKIYNMEECIHAMNVTSSVSTSRTVSADYKKEKDTLSPMASMHHASSKANSTLHKEGSKDLNNEVDMTVRWARYQRAWTSIINPRGVLFFCATLLRTF